MLKSAWSSEPDIRRSRRKREEPQPVIVGCRCARHSDLPNFERLTTMRTYDIFGDVDIGQIYEASSLNLAQFNERQELVSGVCLRNYPNLLSVPTNGWLGWIMKHYNLRDFNETNTLFIHFLVWDERYVGKFFENLLSAILDHAISCRYVILVFPPWTTPVDIFERQMIRIPPVGMADTCKVQVLYTSVHHLQSFRLKVRRAVEEDNDDVIELIHKESKSLKEIYGEYYVSEMLRHPDEHRRLIVSEDEDGLATGVIILNRNFNIDMLNDHFELAPYNGLRELHPMDRAPSIFARSVSELLSLGFRYGKLREKLEDRTNGEQIENTMGIVCHRHRERKVDVRSLKSVSFVDDSMSGRSMDESDTIVNSVDVISVKDEDTSKPNDEDDIIFANSVKGWSKHNLDTTDISGTPPSSRNTSRNSAELKSIKFAGSHQLIEESRVYFPDDESVSKHFEDDHMLGENTVTDLSKKSSTVTITETEASYSSFIRDALLPSIYHGKTNAFVVEIFVAGKKVKERQTWDFLLASFECLPDLDYCVILVPTSCPYFPFLKHFVRVPLRCDKDFPMSLYLTHKAIFLGETRCRLAEFYDQRAIEHFLCGIPKKTDILTLFDVYMNQSRRRSLYCYMFECNGILIGLAMVGKEKSPEVIKAHYHVEDFVCLRNIPSDAHGRIYHFVLMPIFFTYQGFFFHEIERLSSFIVLYYRLYRKDASALTRNHPVAICLNAMVMVNPRNRADHEYWNYRSTDNIDGIGDSTDTDLFSLYITTPRLTMIPIKIIDLKIVVIGASDCGVALAEYLAFGYAQNFVHFTNLTLISPNGLPYDKKITNRATNMIPFKGRYCHNYRHRVAGRVWINIIYGTLSGINRKDKYVTVTDQGMLTYDFLILTCGLQYQRSLMGIEVDEVSETENSNWNCLSINDDTDAYVCTKKIETMTNDFQEWKFIVFYGHNIDCYCAIHGLLELGVKSSWITLVEPKLDPCKTHDHVFFNDIEVDTAVMNLILESGVNILLGWDIIDWTLEEPNEKGKCIKSVTIKQRGQTKTLQCDVLFNFFEKTIDRSTFLAICEAGLVFDGRLVINYECRTNDRYVLAAGTMTKYSRKFYAESWQHEYYDSIEVGERLGKIMNNAVERYRITGEKEILTVCEENHQTLPLFRSPLTISCVLPGGYHYLHVRKSGKIHRDHMMKTNTYGVNLVTGSCTSEIGYFRIRLSPYDTVETVTCFSKKEFSVQRMIALYGKHESLLNGMKFRFKNSFISDFYAYFDEPWAAALFYDRFECLRVENRATLLSKMAVYGDSLIEDCIRALLKSKWEAMFEKDREYIEFRYAGSVYQQELENSLIDFLQFAEDDLPMYCNPRIVRQFYSDIENSPLFLKQ